MGRAKYVVELAEEERVRLRSLLRGGKASVRMVTRARVLLKADEGYTDGAIAAALEVATATVGRIRKRLVEEGLEHALPNRLGNPRHLHPCSATYSMAFSTCRLDSLTLPR